VKAASSFWNHDVADQRRDGASRHRLGEHEQRALPAHLAAAVDFDGHLPANSVEQA
jgi:hypothetical protein